MEIQIQTKEECLNFDITKIPANIESLDICGIELTIELVEQLLKKTKKLKQLIINGGTKLKRIPRTIAGLEQLEKLELIGFHYMPKKECIIPAWIKGLKKLQILDLMHTPITRIPDEIGGLTQLRELSLAVCEFVPDTIKELKNLEVLSISGETWARLKKFPEGICELKNLRSLNLSGHVFNGIPDSFFELNKIKVLLLYKTKFGKDHTLIKKRILKSFGKKVPFEYD